MAFLLLHTRSVGLFVGAGVGAAVASQVQGTGVVGASVTGDGVGANVVGGAMGEGVFFGSFLRTSFPAGLVFVPFRAAGLLSAATNSNILRAL